MSTYIVVLEHEGGVVTYNGPFDSFGEADQWGMSQAHLDVLYLTTLEVLLVEDVEYVSMKYVQPLVEGLKELAEMLDHSEPWRAREIRETLKKFEERVRC